jgi:hypothetical protein
MTNRKFYRVVYQVEVLSETPYDTVNLNDIACDIYDGPCGGNVKIVESQEVGGAVMAKLLQGQGSDPEFFGIDNDGNDVDTDLFDNEIEES